MTLGDGIRRNIMAVSPGEQQRFINAIIQLNQRPFPGSRTDFPAPHCQAGLRHPGAAGPLCRA
jgi:hypothetical protein